MQKKCYAYVFMLRFDQGWHIQTRFDCRPAWKTIFSNEAYSETAIDNALQTDSV